jgi:hypothetical protein
MGVNQGCWNGVPRAKALALPVNDGKYRDPHGQASLRPWHPTKKGEPV